MKPGDGTVPAAALDLRVAAYFGSFREPREVLAFADAVARLPPGERAILHAAVLLEDECR